MTDSIDDKALIQLLRECADAPQNHSASTFTYVLRRSLKLFDVSRSDFTRAFGMGQVTFENLLTGVEVPTFAERKKYAKWLVERTGGASCPAGLTEDEQNLWKGEFPAYLTPLDAVRVALTALSTERAKSKKGR